MFIKMLTVAGLATFEIYAAIPAGFALGLPAWMIFVASLVGGLIGVYVAAFLGDKIRLFFARYRKPKSPKPATGFIYQLWEKYGTIGLSFIGTITVGAPVSIGVGVGLNVPVKKMLFWCCLAVFTRCAVFTTLGYYGAKML